MTGSLLSLNDVSYRYPDGTCALNSCSLTIRKGTRTTVLGANGAGKTTMFLHLNGILRPTSGQVQWEETTLDYSRDGMRKLRSQVGLVFQNPDSQLFSASVREDVYFYGPRTGWALRYLMGEQPLCSLLLHGDAPVGIVALSAGATAAVDWKTMSPPVSTAKPCRPRRDRARWPSPPAPAMKRLSPC